MKKSTLVNNRNELLKQQKRLHNQHCVTCPKRNDRNAKGCKKCDVFIQFKEIGKCLLGLNKSPNTPVSQRKSKNDILAESKTDYGMVLTIDRYLDLQELGMKNYEIAEQYGITDKELNEWKVWQGLTGKRGPVSKQDLACSS